MTVATSYRLSVLEADKIFAVEMGLMSSLETCRLLATPTTPAGGSWGWGGGKLPISRDDINPVSTIDERSVSRQSLCVRPFEIIPA